jgi:hypothetical protein
MTIGANRILRRPLHWRHKLPASQSHNRVVGALPALLALHASRRDNSHGGFLMQQFS